MGNRQVLFDEIHKFVNGAFSICDHLQREAIMIVEQSFLSNNITFDRFDRNLCIETIFIDILETCTIAKCII